MVNENGDHATGNTVHRHVLWSIQLLFCKRGSGLVASGAGNGFVRLWGVESESRAIQSLYQLPLVSLFS